MVAVKWVLMLPFLGLFFSQAACAKTTGNDEKKEGPSVVFMMPHTNDEHFWGYVHGFASAVAKDIGVEFDIVYNTT